MKIKFKALKRLIKEEVDDNDINSIDRFESIIREGYEKDGAFYGLGEELQQIIAAMPPDELSPFDYIDEETGEILLGKGDKPRSSAHHPTYADDQQHKRAARDARYAAEEAEYQEELRAEEDARAEKNKASADFDKAVKEFAAGGADYVGDNPDDIDNLQSAATDMADGFFYSYPEWRSWAALLKMSKADIKDLIASEIYEVMIKK